MRYVRAGAALLAALLADCTIDGVGQGTQGNLNTERASAAVADAPNLPPPVASLRDVVSTRALVGRRIRVTGRCLSPESEHPLGQPPRPHDEWQLEAEGMAIFVIGPQPRGCGSSGGSPVTIAALVAEDTLPALGELPSVPRRFLVIGGEGR